MSLSRDTCDSVLDMIGETPCVTLNSVGKEDSVKCNLVAKCEYMNAGGSVKDRIALQMIQDAEQGGLLKPGDTLIEPTSGNTGIGLALCAAVKGYRCIIVMPEKMSNEKVRVLKALGAEIIRTPTEAAWDAPESHISVAKRLKEELGERAHILDQYSNPSNPQAHYQHTAEELWTQCHEKIDMVVCGAGTGGTITGIAKRLKELNPEIIIVGVDPEGSILAQPDSLNETETNHYQVEGIGYDFIPQVLDRSLVDEWYKSNDKESLIMMRRLIREEGLLCGGSSGAAVSVAIKAARSLSEGQTCAIILPDSVRNYMTKALDDDWMVQHGFMTTHTPAQHWWSQCHLSDLDLSTPLTITSQVTCKEAIALLKNQGFDMVPVLEDGVVVGVVTEGNLHSKMVKHASAESTVAEAGVIYKTFQAFAPDTELSVLAQALDSEPYALVMQDGVVSGVVTRIDLLDFISKRAK